MAALFAGYLIYQKADSAAGSSVQKERLLEVSQIREKYQKYEKDILAIAAPSDMDPNAFAELKAKALEGFDYSMLSAIPDDLEITDVMLEQIRQLPEPGNDWGTLMKNLGVIPSAYAELALASPSSLPFVLKYQDRASMQNAPAALEEPLDTVPLLYTFDDRWGYSSFGDSTIAVNGDMLLCLSMALSYETKNPEITPAALAALADEHHLSGDDSSQEELFSEAAKKWSVSVLPVDLSEWSLQDCLSAGHPVILKMNPGTFGKKSSWILVYAQEDGKFRIQDPDSEKNSTELWSASDLLSSAVSGWVIGSQQTETESQPADAPEPENSEEEMIPPEQPAEENPGAVPDESEEQPETTDETQWQEDVQPEPDMQ